MTRIISEKKFSYSHAKNQKLKTKFQIFITSAKDIFKYGSKDEKRF